MDFKKILEQSIKLGVHHNLNELYGAYAIDALVLKKPEMEDKLKEFTKMAEEAMKKYEVTGEMLLSEVLEKIS